MGTSHSRHRFDLLLASLGALVTELAFIRFVPAHVRVVGYFTNLMLIAAFLGIGLGFLLSSRALGLKRYICLAIILVIAATAGFSHFLVRSPVSNDEIFWLRDSHQQATLGELGIEAVVVLLFFAVALALIPWGHAMGRAFSVLPPLEAYAINLGGSLLGVVLFGLLSALATGPIIWFSLIVMIALALAHTRDDFIYNGIAGIAIVALLYQFAIPGEVWSPYYRVTLHRRDAAHIDVLANGNFHQSMYDLRGADQFTRLTRERFQIPYQQATALDDVLIVGAGCGNDIVIARSMGAKHIDAVEIDPVFPQLGQQYHPQHPYDSDKVTLHITDARAYFKSCKKRYDLVVFGTLDSQSLLSGLSSIRLDNYVYTKESFAEAYRLLKPSGILAVFQWSQSPHVADRVILLLQAAAGGKFPQTRYFEEATLFNMLFMQGADLPEPQLTPELAARLQSWDVPSDDWPFLYLKNPGIPSHYRNVLCFVVLITTLALFGILRSEDKNGPEDSDGSKDSHGHEDGDGSEIRGNNVLSRFDSPLFLLGAGFLLLETKSVTAMSLLFGSTWTVNLLVFSSILLVLLGANLLVLWLERKSIRLPHRPLFFLLLALLCGLSFIPVHLMAALSPLWKWLCAGAFVGLPIGVAGLLFPTLLSRARNVRWAMGSNLIGAIVGGACEYITMWQGISALNYIAAILYLLALGIVERRGAEGSFEGAE